MTAQQEIQKNLRHNYIVNFVDNAFYLSSASFRAPTTILPLFISLLTDNPVAIGILSAIVSTGWLVPQLFTANWVQRLPIKKYIPVRIGLFTERLPIFCLVLAAWTASWSKPVALYLGMISIAWFYIGAGVSMVAWQDMFAKIFPAKIRGRFMGAAFFAGTGTGVLGSIAASWVLDHFVFPINFIICFGLAAAFIGISWLSLSLTKEPAVPPKQITSNKTVDWAKIAEVFRTDKNYRKYTLTTIVTNLGSMAVGFFTVYTLGKWQVPNSQIGLFTTFLLGGQAAGYLVFGWFSDRFGHKLSIEINVLLNVTALVIAIFAQDPQMFIVVFAIQGFATAATFLSSTNIIFEFCDPDARPTYIGLSNTVIGIVAGIAPLIGGLIANSLNYTWLFGIAATISLLGFFILRYWVADPHRSDKQQDI